MIRIGFEAKNGGYRIAIVLEPENMDRLRRGDPVILNLNELVLGPKLPFRLDLAIDYTPDSGWVHEEFIRRSGKTAEDLAAVLHDSMGRPEVRKPAYHNPFVTKPNDGQVN